MSSKRYKSRLEARDPSCLKLKYHIHTFMQWGPSIDQSISYSITKLKLQSQKVSIRVSWASAKQSRQELQSPFTMSTFSSTERVTTELARKRASPLAWPHIWSTVWHSLAQPTENMILFKSFFIIIIWFQSPFAMFTFSSVEHVTTELAQKWASPLAWPHFMIYT